MAEDAVSRGRAWFTDALLLGVLSATGYALAFAFEVGYAIHYGYPPYLISPTPGTIAWALFVMVAAVQLLGMSTAIVLRLEHFEDRLDGAYAVVMLMFVAALLMTREPGLTFTYIAPFLVLLPVLSFMYVRWKRAKALRVAGAAPSPAQQRWRRFAILMFVPALVVASMMLARAGGMYTARFQQDFYALASKPEHLVVRMYGDLIVAVKVDLASEQFTGEYVVMKFGEPDARLDLKHIRMSKARPVMPAGFLPLRW